MELFLATFLLRTTPSRKIVSHAGLTLDGNRSVALENGAEIVDRDESVTGAECRLRCLQQEFRVSICEPWAVEPLSAFVCLGPLGGWAFFCIHTGDPTGGAVQDST